MAVIVAIVSGIVILVLFILNIPVFALTNKLNSRIKIEDIEKQHIKGKIKIMVLRKDGEEKWYHELKNPIQYVDGIEPVQLSDHEYSETEFHYPYRINGNLGSTIIRYINADDVEVIE